MNPMIIRIAIAAASGLLAGGLVYVRKKEKKIEAEKQAKIDASKESENKVELPNKQELEEKRVKHEPSTPPDNRQDNVGEVSAGETTGE